MEVEISWREERCEADSAAFMKCSLISLIISNRSLVFPEATVPNSLPNVSFDEGGGVEVVAVSWSQSSSDEEGGGSTKSSQKSQVEDAGGGGGGAQEEIHVAVSEAGLRGGWWSLASMEEK